MSAYVTFPKHNAMRICLLLLVLFISVSSFARAGAEIQIVDKDNSPVAGATVSIVGKNDSTLIDATISDKNGMALLSFDGVFPAVVIVNCLGYEPAQAEYSSSLSKIVLEEASNALNEVVVTARQHTLKRQAGKFVYDPAELKKEVPDLYGLLRLTPLLNVDGSAFSILGKGQSKVFINGRDPKMDDQALVEMLRAMPASQIKSVEIITEPGSTYSASMSGGIINLILDKPNEGFIGSITTDIKYQSDRLSPSIGFWGGYSKDKLNLGLSLGYYTANSHDVVTSDYYYADTDRRVRNKTRNSGWRNSLYGRINASYDINDKSTMGVAFDIGEVQSRSTSNIRSTEQIGLNTETASNSKIETRLPWQRPDYGFQAYYTLNTDSKGSNLDVSAGYVANLTTTNTDYVFSNVPENQLTKVNSSGWHLKPQYRFAFKSGQTLDVGGELYKYNIDNDYRYRNDGNRFVYKETISSAFAQWNARWSNLFSSNLGLRLENSDIDGLQHVGNESFHHNYTNLFPSLSVNFNLPCKGNQSISLSASRFISRPYYSRLNPFVYWTSETTCRKGNIDTQPDYTWYYSMYYSFFNDWTFSAAYRTTPNPEMDYTYREGDITVTSSRNFGKSELLAFNISYNHVFGGFWRVKAYSSLWLLNQQAILNGNDISCESAKLSLNLTNSIVLSQKAKVKLEVDYNFSPPSKSLTKESNTRNLLSVRLIKWIGRHITLSLDAYNLLGFKNDYHYFTPEYSYNNNSHLYDASFTLKFNYIFGKRKVTGATDRYETPLDSRIQHK